MIQIITLHNNKVYMGREMLSRKLNRKKCKECRKLFQPLSSFHPCCSVPCAIEWAKTKECKAYHSDNEKKEARKARKEYNEGKKSYWVGKLQIEFNKFIRNRDKRLPCISCGKTRIQTAKMQGSNFHAGHFKTRGARPELRFDESNCHKQCAHCNVHLSGNLAEYRKNLIKKIGLDEVLRIEGPNEAKNYTIPDLKEMITYYKEQLR